MQELSTCLWFDGKAEEAMNFYVSVFKDAKVIGVSRYGENAPMPAGTVLTATFEINGMRFTALNGGPQYHFTPAISFIVPCETQDEVDYYWEKLTDGGIEMPCAWLSDKYGVSWQIVPNALMRLMSDPDKEKAGRVMHAMFQMKKIDIAALEAAYQG
jgi:predicted 3-demethylubiquinone-9 3-methyltransferase (glyoxalase superfamily)